MEDWARSCGCSRCFEVAGGVGERALKVSVVRSCSKRRAMDGSRTRRAEKALGLLDGGWVVRDMWIMFRVMVLVPSARGSSGSASSTVDDAAQRAEGDVTSVGSTNTRFKERIRQAITMPADAARF